MWTGTMQMQGEKYSFHASRVEVEIKVASLQRYEKATSA